MKSPLRNWSLRNRLTAGVLVLSAIGFIGAGVVVQKSLSSYLIGQVDEQLLSVIGGTSQRVNQAGIVNDDESNPNYSENDESPKKAAAPVTPLNRVPTAISVTLLDSNGAFVGGIGGDLNASKIADFVTGWSPEKIASLGSKPFTLEVPGSDFRVVSEVLPSSAGSVIVAQSLADFDKTTHRINRIFSLIGS